MRSMTDVATVPTDHDAPSELFEVPGPLATPAGVTERRRTPAEHARTLVQHSILGTLSTLTRDGDPWGSLVSYGVLEDGSPVFLVSRLAEHTRNLEGDARASLVVAEQAREGDPLDHGRVTLAGRVVRPEGERLAAARAAHLAAVPSAEIYIDFGDFSLFVLEVERVRWVGGYGRMDSTNAEQYREAAPDPVAPHAAYAINHLNEDHADALLLMAQALAGYTDATEALCVRADRYGLDLKLRTPRGTAHDVRVSFTEPCTAPDGLRAATVDLAKRARAIG